MLLPFPMSNKCPPSAQPSPHPHRPSTNTHGSEWQAMVDLGGSCRPTSSSSQLMKLQSSPPGRRARRAAVSLQATPAPRPLLLPLIAASTKSSIRALTPVCPCAPSRLRLACVPHSNALPSSTPPWTPVNHLGILGCLQPAVSMVPSCGDSKCWHHTPVSSAGGAESLRRALRVLPLLLILPFF